MSTLPALEEKIPALIDQARPATVLAIGPLAQALVAPACGEAITYTALDPAQAPGALASTGHQDLAIIAGDLDRLPPKPAGQLLSQLRDLYAAWVIVVVDYQTPPPGWSRRDMIGFGFSLLGDALYGQTRVHVYEFDMATYKTTPDWLNSKYWANPELWGKYRW